jgi:methionyl aminopeptidase
MAISIKNDDQIKIMQKTGAIVGRTHELLAKELRAGITTYELDKIAEEYIISQGAVPSFKGYHGFPATLCISINDEIIHGIPGNRKIMDGDVVSIDIGACKDGFHGDAARTLGVGDISKESQTLIDVTKQCFFEGIKFAKAGNHLFEISEAIQTYVESFGFSIVRDYVGHGIGKELHEEPQIPNYKPSGRGVKLQKGMALAIEPMVNIGTHEIKRLKDKWTIVTKDGKFSAHYENSIAITDNEPIILTLI